MAEQEERQGFQTFATSGRFHVLLLFSTRRSLPTLCSVLLLRWVTLILAVLAQVSRCVPPHPTSEKLKCSCGM